jgi:hypothetical protein
MDNTFQIDDSRFKIFHDLMLKKVQNILLISRQYDAWIMEEDCRLSEKIVQEYKGLNLSNPPRLRWVSTAAQALQALEQRQFDLVIIIARDTDNDAEKIAGLIKSECRDIPVNLMLHRIDSAREPSPALIENSAISRSFLWRGNTEVLLALIKSTEDWMNVEQDALLAGIRVILFVEDSPEYTSVILPILYKELVLQTQAVMEEGLNEEHKLLAMRARPKILVVENFEKAMAAYDKFKDNVLGVISDVRFPRQGKLDGQAGLRLLETIKSERFDIPLLLISSESHNREFAAKIPARFVDKNSQTLPSDIRRYFKENLGFGAFVFRMPDGRQIGKAKNLRGIEKQLASLPEESFLLHCRKNDFSRWLFARSEIDLAAQVRPIRDEDFADVRSHCEHLAFIIHQRRMKRQRGLVLDFDLKNLDSDTEFCKIGSGSLGGKARGLAFMNTLLHQRTDLKRKYAGIKIRIPQTMVITVDEFERFVEINKLHDLAKQELTDDAIADRFLASEMPNPLVQKLKGYIVNFTYPLAVRSSSLLEDAQYRAYAGLYNTYMLANDHVDVGCRLDQLVSAVKMVFASTYFSGPKAFSKRVGHRVEEEKMAVIVQELAGQRHSGNYYPSISGVAQSYNYYPFAQMKPQDGVAAIALGLGKSVMGGESSLRFSPKYPNLLPDRSKLADILKNSQRHFYSVKMGVETCQLGADDSATLARREIYDALDELPVKLLSSTYFLEEDRIRDVFSGSGSPVVTFHSVLKHGSFPLAALLTELLRVGEQGMGSAVEMEFCINLGSESEPGEFVVLQLRPMGAREELMRVDISQEEIDTAIIYSRKALGNTVNPEIQDIVFVKPQEFDPSKTKLVAKEISQLNAQLMSENRNYLLIGPGRWGSADPWLGIPVRWEDICGVGAIVETDHHQMHPEPSQGSHFFHNITTLGINYLTASESTGGRIDWQWLCEQPRIKETKQVALMHHERPLMLKVDGKNSKAVVCVNGN